METTLVFIILFLACINLPVVRSACRWDGSIESEGACFLYNSTALSYPDAKIACQAKGGVLAKVKTMKQMSDITVGSTRYPNFWIGANDNETEGTWVWEDDGSNATELELFWNPGQPDNGEIGYDCSWVHINKTFDNFCSLQEPFFCMEKDLTTTPDPVTSQSTTNDPAITNTEASTTDTSATTNTEVSTTVTSATTNTEASTTDTSATTNTAASTTDTSATTNIAASTTDTSATTNTAASTTDTSATTNNAASTTDTSATTNTAPSTTVTNPTTNTAASTTGTRATTPTMSTPVTSITQITTLKKNGTTHIQFNVLLILHLCTFIYLVI